MLPETLAASNLPPPWNNFLNEVDMLLSTPIELHCLGGFVVTAVYGAPRRTVDLDYVSIVPREELTRLEEIAGRESELARRHKVYAQYVAIADIPENYDERLVETIPGSFKNLRLLALDPYDLVLSKLTSNRPLDREDVKFLAGSVRLDPNVLRDRYERELRPYLANEQKHDLTLKLWLEAYFQR